MSEDLLQLPVFHRAVPEQGSADAAAAVGRCRPGDAGNPRGADDVDQRGVQVEPRAARTAARRAARSQHATAGARSQVSVINYTAR